MSIAARITRRIRTAPFIIGTLLAAVALAAAACGGGGYSSGSSSGSSPAATAPQASQTGAAAAGQMTPAGAVAGQEATPSAASAGITVIAMNMSFDKTSLQASAGEVTFTLDNQDGIAHDLHVFKGSDASGQSVGMTPIEAGPVENSFTAQLQPGTYYYQCDVHPTEMHGMLTVS